MNILHRIARGALALVVLLACAAAAHAQTTFGNVRGVVRDPQGAVVPGATVVITNKETNASLTTQTTGEGEYQFNNLLVGTYSVKIEAPSFKTLTLTNVLVELNQTTDVPSELTVGGVGETIEVNAGGAELVDTTTTTLSKGFNERQAVDLGVTNVGGAFGGGVNNLALLAPNVSTSGGVGVGTGGSVGGQRPRNNNFVLDGVDNNRKDVTGPTVYVSPDNVAEFSLLQNQFSAEFARSNGGQFITVTKSGTNDLHGSGYGFIRNRYLNSLDTLQKNAGVIRERVAGREDDYFPRSDFFRGGANLGGPVYFPRFGEGGRPYYSGRDKLFFYTSYERLQVGTAAGVGGITTPTAAGFSVINAQPGLSASNLAVFNQFVPVAGAQTDTIDFCRVTRVGGVCPDGQSVAVPVGLVSIPSPNFTKQNHFLLNLDYNQSESTQHRFRFTMTNTADVDTAANLPQFFITAPILGRLFSYTLLHNFTPNLINETRLAYRRYEQPTPAPTQFNFPGLDVFPNVILDDLALNIGPNPNAPQTYAENNYQVVNNLTWLRGAHSFKFGADFRRVISPQSFVQRERGDYEYGNIDTFLRDQSPDVFGQRTVGASPYYGDQHVLFSYVQDDWRVRENLTINLGLNHSYQQMPKGAKLQSLNAISSVPGLIEFREPREQLKNFGPRVGLAYAPNFEGGLLGRVFGAGNKSSIRAGFSMAYDYIFDNLYILSLPPQSNQTLDLNPAVRTANFLAGGGLRGTPAVITDPAEARAATSAFIPDQEVPYSLTWTLGFQRQFLKDYSLELRYLGTRGVHLLTQNRLNSRAPVNASRHLPTFLSAPTQAQVDALGLSLADLLAESPLVPRYENAGFNGNFLVGFLSNGNSTYHGASAQVQRRFSEGFQMSAAYTWSHLIDDTTAEVFSTVLSPRRVQDFQNLRTERADSALDRRHRFVLGFIYDVPFLRNHGNGFVRTALGGWSFAGVYAAESGQKATVLSGIDSNLNLDAAPDRTIRNAAGTRDTGSTVSPLLRTCTSFDGAGNCATPLEARIVGYRADNPNAEYIQAGLGAFANSARNTLLLPGINNFDLSLFKDFRFGETKKFRLRADFFNAFNHPQYIPGSPNDVSPIPTTAAGNVNTVGRRDFNRPDRVFSSNPRVIQLGLRFDF
ncbi:MAG: carboxypeptidase regulatory-like domain-containing protein [Acidobacteria bacterium]|nr:carboxypeptidase regulatory-like domain-containing protein [Acidobacteriota bacterium]